MNRIQTVRLCSLLLAVLATSIAGALPSAAAEKSVSQLEEEYNREPSPKRRAGLALDITEARLGVLVAAYQNVEAAKVKDDSASYLTAIDRLDHAVQDPEVKGGTKECEVGLRRQIKSLGDLRLTLSSQEQPPLDHVLMKVTQLHERILYSLMNLEKKKQP